MNSKLMYILVIITLISSLVSIGLNYMQPRAKLVYVRSADLVSKYEGMKETKAAYEKKLEAWQSNLEVLTKLYQEELNKYKQAYNQLTNNEKLAREQVLEAKQNEVLKYKQEVEKKAQEEDIKMTQGYLNQINSFVEKYSKEHNYNIVLGTSSSGNILYADNNLDITEELTEALNEEYKSAEN